MVQALQFEIGRILKEEIDQASQQQQFRESFVELRNKISSLQVDIDFIQAVQEGLILPFTKSPSLKVLGNALYTLTQRAIPLVQVDCIQLLVEDQIVNADIRLMEFQLGARVSVEHTVSVSQEAVSILLPSNGRSILIKVLYKETEEGMTDLVV